MTEGKPGIGPGASQDPLPPDRLALTVLVALLAGGAARLAGKTAAAHALWAGTVALALVPLAWTVARDLWHRKVGVDLIALLSMAFSLALGEYAAGAVIALMLSGGQALEARAQGRAQRELKSLLARAPKVVHRYENGGLTSPRPEEVLAGDLLLVKPGETVPADGQVESAEAVLDESTLTGEALPVTRERGDPVRSGAVNAGGPFDLRAVASVEHSTYAGIVRLAGEAAFSRPPFVRLADRYALAFLPFTVAVAGLAWAWSGDPKRALAVLVVATPCPLILAAPVALVAGLSRAASRGVLVKNGAALEALARARVLLLDKTGTLTTGRPRLTDVAVFDDLDRDELLRLAGSLDRVSAHVLAGAVVHAAQQRKLLLAFPSATAEIPGSGIQGRVDGRVVALGRLDWLAESAHVPPAARALRRKGAGEGAMNVFIAVDGAVRGALVLRDVLRADARATVQGLRDAGIERVVLVTGDRIEPAQSVAAAVGVDAVLAERSPAEKVAAVRAEAVHGTTLMVGDGVNDAPALAAADIGIALGARGATASSETADVVVIPDRLDRVAEVVRIAKRSRGIAVQSVVAGMGLSGAAMLVAAFGYLPPLAGALLQEAIDVVVILNALRALRSPASDRRRARDPQAEERWRSQHLDLQPDVERLRETADRLHLQPAPETLRQLENLLVFLRERLRRHNLEEEQTFYPLISRALGAKESTAPMARAHLEIDHLTRCLADLTGELREQGETDAALAPETLADLRRVLYGLHAVVTLHLAQEDELYLPLLG